MVLSLSHAWNSLCFLLLFYFSPLGASLQAQLQPKPEQKQPKTSKPSTNTLFLPTHYHRSQIYLFFQYRGWFICTYIWSQMDYCSQKKGVNNAALNYKNEYLKMKPALAEPSESRCSIMRVAVIYDLLIKIPWWRKDAVIGRQERCLIVYGFWTFVLVLEAWT